MARGFLIGATAGRTTLTGEGLQHADGHSPLLASTNPAMLTYDPAYGFEIGHIVHDGLRRMNGDKPENVIYYLTVYNEPIVQPAEPENLDVESLLKGMYLLHPGRPDSDRPRVQLLASGVAMAWALEAQELLEQDFGVDADVWSVSYWNELRRDGLACDEQAFLAPDGEQRTSFVTQQLSGRRGPAVGVSDYMHAVPDQIRAWVPMDYATLGADGFGLSDTRPAARRHFHIDGPSIAVRALQSLAARGEIDASAAREAAAKYRLLDVSAGTSGNSGGQT
jgi:pyruvate dehydrogenase E1 component